MKLLVLASDYPYAGHSFAGVFNEKSVSTLCRLCDDVTVLSPRPFVPPLVSSLLSRWKAYSAATGYEVRNGITVHRPPYPQLPGLAGGFCHDQGAFLWCRRMVQKMHDRMGFHAVLSFDVSGTGVMGWRIGSDLGIPTATWVTGRAPCSSSQRQAAIRAVTSSDLVFYQSQDCWESIADLLETSSTKMAPDRNIILPRGIEEPPDLPRLELRKRIRTEWGIAEDQVLVLSIGRIRRDKGLFELLEALSVVHARDQKVTCIVVGSLPAFDDTALVQKKLRQHPGLEKHVKILPACNNEKVWEYLCAADIFAFTSHHEGMPNSLLEAMAMAVPAIAFGIPPVSELEAGTGALITVPPFDTFLFAEAILHLARSPAARFSTAQKGKIQILTRFMVRKNMAHALKYISGVVEKHDAPNGR